MENLIFYITHGVSLLCAATVFYQIFSLAEVAPDLVQRIKKAADDPESVEEPLAGNMTWHDAAHSAIARLFSRRQVFSSSAGVSREKLSIEQVKERLITELKL